MLHCCSIFCIYCTCSSFAWDIYVLATNIYVSNILLCVCSVSKQRCTCTHNATAQRSTCKAVQKFSETELCIWVLRRHIRNIVADIRNCLFGTLCSCLLQNIFNNRLACAAFCNLNKVVQRQLFCCRFNKATAQTAHQSFTCIAAAFANFHSLLCRSFCTHKCSNCRLPTGQCCQRHKRGIFCNTCTRVPQKCCAVTHSVCRLLLRLLCSLHGFYRIAVHIQRCTVFFIHNAFKLCLLSQQSVIFSHVHLIAKTIVNFILHCGKLFCNICKAAFCSLIVCIVFVFLPVFICLHTSIGKYTCRRIIAFTNALCGQLQSFCKV